MVFFIADVGSAYRTDLSKKLLKDYSLRDRTEIFATLKERGVIVIIGRLDHVGKLRW